MGSFVRRCGVNPSTASVPLVISSGTWDVIAEGLKSAQGKCALAPNFGSGGSGGLGTWG